MKNYTKRLTSIGITTALLIIGGAFIYGASYLLGGAQIFKVVLLSLYFSILLYLLIVRSPEPWTLTLLSVVLGLLLSVFSLIMTLAIILTGVFSDLTSYALFRGYGKGKQQIVSVGLYPLFSVIFSLYLTSKFTVNYSPGIITMLYIFGGLGAFLLGIVGGYLGHYLNKKYIHAEVNTNPS